MGPFSLSTNRSWFEVRNAVNGVTDVFLYDTIGRNGVTAEAFLAAFQAIKSKAINLHINSEGGGVDAGIAIYTAVQAHPASVHGTVDSLAASIASVILQACDRRTMMAGSSLMVHEPYMGIDARVVGHAGDMRDLATTANKQADYLDKMADNIAGLYSARAGGTEAEWRSVMQAETWYRAQEAVDAGLADDVSAAKTAKNQVDRAFNLADFRNVPDWFRDTITAPGITSPVATMTINVPGELDPVRAEQIYAQLEAELRSQLGISEPESPLTGLQIDRKSPFLSHHDLAGAVDPDRLAVVLARAHNLNIPVPDREEAIRHLQGHATQRGAKAA